MAEICAALRAADLASFASSIRPDGPALASALKRAVGLLLLAGWEEGRGLGGAFLAFNLAAGVPAQTRSSQIPRMASLPEVQHELEAVCARLGDADLARFALGVAYEEYYPQLHLQGVAWDKVLATLGDALQRRPKLGSEWVEFTWMRATSCISAGRTGEARELLDATLAHPSSDGPLLGWIQSSLAQVAMSEERWLEAQAHFEAAERERGRVRNAADFGPWIESLRNEFWLLIGMQELALPYVESQWERERESDDIHVRWRAFDYWMTCLSLADDYAAISDLERELRESGWLDRLSAHDRARADRRFAYALVERGQFQPAANAEARRRLEALLAGGELEVPDERSALESLTLAALDGKEPAAARDAVARLRALYEDHATRGLAGDWSADHLAQLVALEALVALAEDREGTYTGDLAAHVAATTAAWARVRHGWSNLPTREGGIGYLFKARRHYLIEAMLSLELRVHGPQAGAARALEWLVEAQLESTLARRLESESTTFEAARATLLPPGRGLIAWIPLRSRSFAVAVDGERGLLLELQPSAQLEARANELMNAVGEQVRAGAARAGDGLERAVDAATQAFLPQDLLAFASTWDELYVCGLDDAGYLPFELLSDGRGGTQGERPVARVPSIPALLTLARRHADGPAADSLPPRALLVIADRPSEEMVAAHGVAAFDVPAELRDGLRRGWADGALRELSGPEADPDAVSRALSERCAFVHVVAHGIERPYERPQGLLLAPGDVSSGEVYAEDVEGWNAPPMLLLSVCASARAGARRGDGSRSDVVAALLLSGAGCVAASSAELDVSPTLRVGARVQAELQRGASLAAALSAARAHFAAQGTDHRREWIAAHLLQVNGAGFDIRLPGGAARRSTRAWIFALPLGVVVLGLAGWQALSARRRT